MMLLVRHAATVRDPRVPADRWVLDPAGAGELARLRAARDWSTVRHWYSSPEPKARDTARALGATSLRIADELRELERPSWTDEYDETVRRLFADHTTPAGAGWETGESAVTRFDRRVRRIARAHLGEDVVVVTHGLVLTLWRARVAGRPADLAGWRGLRLPDLLLIPDEELGNWLADANRLIEPLPWHPNPPTPGE